MVNREQMSVQFHVDDLKVSHKDQAILDNFLDKLRSKFEQEDKLTKNKELMHEYLGITIYYLIAGKVVFKIFDYLEDLIVKCAEDLDKQSFLLSGKQSLFKVIKDLPRLLLKYTKLFHRHVARLLFASNRARPDIQVCVAFLCIRIKSPVEQGYR